MNLLYLNIVPAPVRGLFPIEIGTTYVLFTWGLPIGDYDSYELSYLKGTAREEKIISASDTNVRVEFLDPNTMYTFNMVTLSAALRSEASDQLFTTSK